MSLNNHPRRSQKHANSPPPLLSNSFRKSDTFSARTNLRSSLFNPNITSSRRPQRSPTSLDEDFVLDQAQLAATRQEIVDKYLRDVDDVLQGNSVDSCLQFLNNQHVLAVPTAVANQIIIPDSMELDEKKVVAEHHHHCSDSGLGSSIDTPQQGTPSQQSKMMGYANSLQDTQSSASALSSVTTAGTVQSAITKSFSAEFINSQSSGPALSAEALKHIQLKIIDPLLANLDLKDFHPLIAAVPCQAQAKIICNLRDLEKQFLYGAPINRYAGIMRATRERQERGEPADEMDYTPGETIAIEGGFSVNGRPAELVRKQNGKSIHLVPEEDRTKMNDMAPFKRPFQDDDSGSDNDDVLRSMARRRKSDKAGDVVHVCTDCKKEFKRPCDLTKHEKTHSRPFKCSDSSCRYHDLGWPTEKERDRHVNDKHSAAPKMYSCQFDNCSYSSKRESNCKQHMEKAHGWTYVRSKSNGRKRASTASASVSMTPSTPMSPFETTPRHTPQSTTAPSPWSAHVQQFSGESSRSPQRPVYDAQRRESVGTAYTNYTYPSSNGYSPTNVDCDVKFPAMSSAAGPFLSPDFASASYTSPPLFQGSVNYSTPAITGPFTPEAMASYNYNSSASMSMLPTLSAPLQPSHFSPTGQGDLTLFCPEVDDNYGNTEADLMQDFVLFPPSSANDTTNMTNTWLDSSNNNFGGQFDFYDQTSMFPPQ